MAPGCSKPALPVRGRHFRMLSHHELCDDSVLSIAICREMLCQTVT
jgi:hypothetical protein